jgi:hypothetical protein
LFRCFEPLKTIPSGGFLHSRHHGTMYPPFIDLAAAEALEQDWESDANDIFICTHQKVGTHLTKRFVVEILRRALAGSGASIYDTGDIGHGTVPWPEVMVSQYGRKSFDEHIRSTHGYPRLWYIHSKIGQLPLRRIHPETRFVVVYRDPRAVAVSQYFFYRQHPLLGVPQDLSLDRFADLFVEGDLYFGDYHHHVADWAGAANPAIMPCQILAVSYEELVEDKHASALKLAGFLVPHWRPADEDIFSIVRSTEFDRMKLEITANPQSFHFKPETFFRAGQVRDWENHLSPRAVEAIDIKTQAEWKNPLGISAPACSE